MEEAPEEKSNPLKQIRTFQGDVATALARQRESLVSIQRQEAVKRGAVPEELSTEALVSKKRKEFFFLFLGSFALIALGLLGAWFGYQEFLRKSAPPTIITPESRFIPSNSSVSINLKESSREVAVDQINKVIINTPQNELRHIILDTSAAEFLKILESKTPGSLVRALDPVFMLGALGGNPFIIFKISSFENAFAGMLSWEANLAGDLGPIFTGPELLKVITPESVFKDTVSRNKDVRVLYANITATTTAPVMMYSFFDNKMLILTNSFETLQILVDRIAQELLVH